MKGLKSMTYKVLKPLEIFNTRWNVGDIITEIDIDWIFSSNTKEYLILDGWIEETDKEINSDIMDFILDEELIKLRERNNEKFKKFITESVSNMLKEYDAYNVNTDFKTEDKIFLIEILLEKKLSDEIL